MKIGEIVDISGDLPSGEPCMVILTTGCNLNCKFCNKIHLSNHNGGKFYDTDKLLKIINNNSLIKSIYIAGGEPTIQNDIIEFCKGLKEIGKEITMETNGFKPNIIMELLPYINYVILNLFGPFDKRRYSQITNSNIRIKRLIETFEILNDHRSITFDIRLIYIKNLLGSEEIHQIFDVLSKRDFRGKFILKQYEYLKGVGEEFKKKYQKPEHIDLINVFKPYMNKTFPYEMYLEDDVYKHAEIHKVFQKIIT